MIYSIIYIIIILAFFFIKQINDTERPLFYPTRQDNLMLHVSDSATSWTIGRRAPLSTGLSQQEYRSELSSPSPGDLPYPETELVSLASLVLQDLPTKPCLQLTVALMI